MNRALLALSFLLSACGDPPPTDTSGIPTRELSLQVLVETDEVETSVAVGIYALGEAYSRLSLVGEEKLVLRVEGAAPIELTKDERSGLVTYRAKVPIVEGTFALDLERAGDSAPGTVVSLTPAFTIAVPAGGLQLDQPFTMTWSPAAPETTLRASITSECVSVAARTLAHDSGAFTWSAGDYAMTDSAPPCTATIRLVRSGGSIRLAPELGRVQLFRSEQVRAFGVLASKP
jgi:hypothetical protein